MKKRITIPNRVSSTCCKFVVMDKERGERVVFYVHVDRLVPPDRKSVGPVCRIRIWPKGARGSIFERALSRITAHINTQLKIIEVTP